MFYFEIVSTIDIFCQRLFKHVTCVDADADLGAGSVTSNVHRAGGKKKQQSLSIRHWWQMLYENSVVLGVGSFLAKNDRSPFCIPRERERVVTTHQCSDGTKQRYKRLQTNNSLYLRQH